MEDSFRKYGSLIALCRNISENPSDLNLLEALKTNIHNAPKQFVRAAEKPLIISFFPYMQNAAKNKTSLTSKGKLLLVEALKELFDKIEVERPNIFFNFYTFLLLELYDYGEHKVLPVSEEYKLMLLEALISLINSVSLMTLEELYAKENIPKFSQIIYVCSQIAKNDAARNIRCTAITCIMAMARVLKDDDLLDVVLRSKCADMFMFFLPGLSSTLPEIALEDLKVGHIIPMMAIRAFGRIISLVMQDYNPRDHQELDIKEMLTKVSTNSTLKGKLQGKKEIDLYLNNTIRNDQWYKTTDEKLNISLKRMGSLTYHSHANVRIEMVNMASSIVNKCATTMPQSIGTLIEHLIILSEDTEPEVSSTSNETVSYLSNRLSVNTLNNVFESLEDRFYNAINSLPRKFNSIDDAEKVATLNLLIGYIKLFGEHNLNNVLLSPNMLHNLVQGLLHITELEKSNISLLEEYTLKDLSSERSFKSPWINFRYFKVEDVKNKLDLLCKELAKSNCFEVIHDSLFDTFLYEANLKKEAVYLINAHISGLEGMCDQYALILKDIINTYAEEPLNDLKTALSSEEYSLDQIQDNVIVICLLTEGIGKISRVLEEKFQVFLLKTLYFVLEKAGSGHPLIRAAGLLALQDLSFSCGYNDITQLINTNFDFFSYHVQRKLTKLEDKDGVLNVLSVVLQYSKVDVLLPMRNIIEEVLVVSCDRFKEKYASAYLQVFKMFILSLRRWFQIEFVTENFKSRKEKELEQEHFKVSGIDNCVDFSGDVMEGKTIEEMFREDMEKRDKEEKYYDIEEDQEMAKPPPPMHVELTSLILKRSLHFLPSKQQQRKLLVLEILENGIEILKDYEDVLLPVVHQIWSPLIHRFKEDKDPLVMRISIRLVSTLAKLAKDFIRIRVVKELIPKIKEILKTSAQTSYLKDKGSAYRYSQSYKLQREILSRIGPILYNLDVERKVICDIIDDLHFYLSDKQPQELQVAVVHFFKVMIIYDCETIKGKIPQLENISEEYNTNLERLKIIQEVQP